MNPYIPSEEELEFLRENYVFKDGKLLWKYSGEEAGYIRNGYRVVRLRRKWLMTHRVIWCLVYGVWPKSIIDHRNQNPLDNQIENLREVTASQNAMNAGARRTNKLGVKGVVFREANKARPYFAHIRLNQKQIPIGHFATLEEAAVARRARELELFGEYAPGA